MKFETVQVGNARVVMAKVMDDVQADSKARFFKDFHGQIDYIRLITIKSRRWKEIDDC